jgi:multidrug efflux pump subunit AcrA (membrane-fusion protein)
MVTQTQLELQRMSEQRDELVTALRACEALTAKRRDEITNHEIMAVRRIILAALAGVMSKGEVRRLG